MVRLAGRQIAEPVHHQVRLGDEIQDRDSRIGAQVDRLESGQQRHQHRGFAQPRRTAEPGMDQIAVEHLLQRRDGVDVGGQSSCRLGFPGRDQGRHGRNAEQSIWLGADGPRGLGEDVIAEGVAGMAQRPVAFRLGLFQRLHAGKRHQASAVDPGLLDGDADPAITAADQFAVGVAPLRRGVGAGADVEPFHNHRAIKRSGLFRSNEDHARRVGRRLVDPDRPSTVPALSASRSVGGRRAGQEILFDAGTERGQIECGERKGGNARDGTRDAHHDLTRMPVSNRSIVIGRLSRRAQCAISIRMHDSNQNKSSVAVFAFGRVAAAVDRRLRRLTTPGLQA